MEEISLQGHSSTDLVRCEELWFEDGSIIIQAENTLFKVHRSILRAQSSVFADMFRFPQSVQQDEQYDGCPLVRLYDSVEELTLCLKGIFDSGTFSSQNKPTFDQVIAFARLGTKYNIRHIRAYGLRILHQAYPLSLDEFDAAQKTRPFTDYSARIFAAINLARELGIPDILPSSFMRALGVDQSMILHGTAAGLQLNQEDKIILFAGRESISNFKSRMYGLLAIPGDCSSNAGCNTTRLGYLHTLMGISVHPLERITTTLLCKKCASEWQRSLDEKRRELWDEIPNMFKLPNWDALCEMRKRDETESKAA